MGANRDAGRNSDPGRRVDRGSLSRSFWRLKSFSFRISKLWLAASAVMRKSKEETVRFRGVQDRAFSTESIRTTSVGGHIWWAGQSVKVEVCMTAGADIVEADDSEEATDESSSEEVMS